MRAVASAVGTLCVAAMLACGASASTAASGGAAGTWALQTANGKPLPYYQYTALSGYQFYVTSDTLVVSDNGTFAERGHLGVGNSSSPVIEPSDSYAYSGSYSSAGSSIAFIFQGGATGTGTLAGNQLNVLFNGAAYMYARR